MENPIQVLKDDVEVVKKAMATLPQRVELHAQIAVWQGIVEVAKNKISELQDEMDKL